MPIVTELGIVTAELCADSKKYISQLLAERLSVGARIKNSNFITWEELLRIETNQEEGEDLAEYVNRWIKKLHPEWNGKNKDDLKQAIINKLNQLETNYLPERLKPYDPEVRNQQEDLRFKKRALIYIGIIAALTIAFPIALGVTTFFGAASLMLGTGILLLYSGLTLASKTLPDPEWYKEHSIETEKWQKKISEITTKPEAILEKAEEPLSNKQIANVKQTEPLRVEAATQTDEHISEPSIRYNFSFFKPVKPAVDSEQKTIDIVPQCITS